jgi:glucose/arabinose dehydrogenase
MVTPAIRIGVLAAILAAATGCGGSSNPPTPGTPGSGGGETITGRERIGWSQQAQDATELASFEYAAYVDGTRRLLTGASCTAAASGAYDCSAPLPTLTPGGHTIELAAFVTSSGTVVESGRSAPLQVTVAGSSAPADAIPPQEATLSTSDGHRFRASVAARGLDDPTDLAVAPDHRVFVSERSGRVRIIDPDDGLLEHPALELDEVVSSADSGLTSIALHPEFDRTGYIYLAYAVEAREGPGFRIARFREHRGVLAQGAVVARQRARAAPHVVVRFGPDATLYAGLAAANDPREAQNAASLLGKILRLTDDGATPRDNPRASLVFSSGHRDPRALAWQPTTGTLWELERDRDGGDELNAVDRGRDYGWPLARGTASDGRSVPAALVLPPGTDVSSASFVPLRSSSPLAGELLVASTGAEDLLRIRIASTGQPGLIEGMLQGRYGRIAAVHVSTDGAIYIATANRDTWGPGRDIVIRVVAIP